MARQKVISTVLMPAVKSLGKRKLLQIILTAVSYTHLDVYKRQVDVNTNINNTAASRFPLPHTAANPDINPGPVAPNPNTSLVTATVPVPTFFFFFLYQSSST